jgi:cytochrome c5
MGSRAVLDALGAGYAPVEFKEHTRAIDVLAGGKPADSDRNERLLRAAELVASALALSSANHGVNIYTKSSMLASLAMFHLELEQFKEAVAAAAQAIKANPLAVHPYSVVARVHAQLGNTEKAGQAMGQLERVFGQACQRCHEARQGTDVCGDGCDDVRRGLQMRAQLLAGGKAKPEL